MTASTTRSVSADRRQRLGLLTEPLGYVDGQNLYEYVGGRPASSQDPTGLQAQEDAFVNDESLPVTADMFLTVPGFTKADLGQLKEGLDQKCVGELGPGAEARNIRFNVTGIRKPAQRRPDEQAPVFVWATFHAQGNVTPLHQGQFQTANPISTAHVEIRGFLAWECHCGGKDPISMLGDESVLRQGGRHVYADRKGLQAAMQELGNQVEAKRKELEAQERTSVTVSIVGPYQPILGGMFEKPFSRLEALQAVLSVVDARGN